jgi:hypothetical protein
MTGISVTLFTIVFGVHVGLAFLQRHGWRLSLGRNQQHHDAQQKAPLGVAAEPKIEKLSP